MAGSQPSTTTMSSPAPEITSNSVREAIQRAYKDAYEELEQALQPSDYPTSDPMSVLETYARHIETIVEEFCYVYDVAETRTNELEASFKHASEVTDALRERLTLAEEQLEAWQTGEYPSPK